MKWARKMEGHKKLLKFSDEDLLKVVEHLSQRKSLDQPKQLTSSDVKQTKAERLKQKEKIKRKRGKRRVQVVNLRSHGNMGVAPSADSAQKFLEGQMSKQKRIAALCLKQKR